MSKFIKGPGGADPAAGVTPAGVNVGGYLRTESGVGAATRGYLRALRALGVPLALKDVSSVSGNRAEDRSVTTFDDGHPYDVNLVCGDIDLHFAMMALLGEEFFRGRYNIAVWAWELPRFPEKWYDRFAYYDEIWVGTSFIANTLAPVSPVPVVRIPPVLTPETEGSRARGRRRLGVADEEFVYLFLFDTNSRLERKNPRAVVEAFTSAFEPSDPARLVIKSVNAGSDREGFAELKARARGHPVSFYDGYWPAEEVRDLTAACDVYVSLHRSEGTGLTITDAMARGKPVIATDWSGNTDFMSVANSYPVRYDLVKLEKKIGPYAAGEVWADPSVEHAAELMRRVFADRAEAEARGRAARRDIEAGYSEEGVGRLIADRLAVIAERRQFTRLKQALAEPVADLEAFLADFRDVERFVPANHLLYRRLLESIGAVVRATVPPDAAVLVVSRGDHELVRLAGGRAGHFPQAADGAYAGHYPADGAAAVAHLEELRGKGAEYLLFPATALWWLEHYADFRRHLETRYRTVACRADACTIFALSESP